MTDAANSAPRAPNRPAQTPDDPKGLLREAYRMDGIGDAECRHILIDWALSLAPGADATAALARLLPIKQAEAPDHPMTALLREGLAPVPKARPRARSRRPRAAGSPDGGGA